MRILYVCHRVPFPPNRGGKIRPFNMISHLSHQHEVTVASIARNTEEYESANGLRDHCEELICEVVGTPAAWARIAVRGVTTVPFSLGYFFSPRLQAEIRCRVEAGRYDLVFVHCSSVAQYVRGFSDLPKILDFGDMDSQKWYEYARFKRGPLRIAYWLEGKKLEAEERRLASSFDLCTCTTAAEMETLRSYATGVESDWFPNGVDHEFFAPVDDDYDANLISFVGRMDYFPNQQAITAFCRDVLPLIQLRRPEARLVIVGANPPTFIQKLGKLTGVTVTGSVPDVRPHVSRSAVNVAPLTIARGTQNKILEAMAMGVPVVTTSIAAKGVDAVPAQHLIVADSAEDQARSVLSLLSAPEQRSRFAMMGRERVLQKHDWKNSMVKLDAIVDRCVQNCQRTAC